MTRFPGHFSITEEINVVARENSETCVFVLVARQCLQSSCRHRFVYICLTEAFAIVKTTKHVRRNMLVSSPVRLPLFLPLPVKLTLGLMHVLSLQPKAAKSNVYNQPQQGLLRCKVSRICHCACVCCTLRRLVDVVVAVSLCLLCLASTNSRLLLCCRAYTYDPAELGTRERGEERRRAKNGVWILCSNANAGSHFFRESLMFEWRVQVLRCLLQKRD